MATTPAKVIRFPSLIISVLVELLIKSCTKEGDSVLVLFGGSGSELVLCQQLKRHFLSCEIHPEYYQMIQARLADGGRIQPEHKLTLGKQRKKNTPTTLALDFSIAS